MACLPSTPGASAWRCCRGPCPWRAGRCPRTYNHHHISRRRSDRRPTSHQPAIPDPEACLPSLLAVVNCSRWPVTGSSQQGHRLAMVTHMVTPVTHRERSEHRYRPDLPTSSAYRSWGRGALACRVGKHRHRKAGGQLLVSCLLPAPLYGCARVRYVYVYMYVWSGM